MQAKNVPVYRIFRRQVSSHAVPEPFHLKNVVFWKHVLGNQSVKAIVLPSCLNIFLETNTYVQNLLSSPHFLTPRFLLQVDETFRRMDNNCPKIAVQQLDIHFAVQPVPYYSLLFVFHLFVLVSCSIPLI